MLIFGIVIAIILSRLIWRAFQGGCIANGVSEYHGAWVILKWLVILGIGGFIGLIALAAYLSSLNAVRP
jgi:hypothetical protein